jgi:16S rRNA (guanine527-N7)-methyltransferase
VASREQNERKFSDERHACSSMKHLISGAARLGLALTERQLAAFQVYYRELVAWNERVNLTSITAFEEVQTKHFLDSLACLQAIPDPLQEMGARAIDVGSGAGLPGLPLKIVWPGLKLTLLEATGKKIAFLEHLAGRLELAGVTVVQGRAEELAHDAAHREAYDLVLARALAELATLAELTLPFSSIGGLVVAPKGADVAGEVQAAARAVGELGGRLRQIVPLDLTPLLSPRNLVVLDKVSATPGKYPRRPGIPARRPLR